MSYQPWDSRRPDYRDRDYRNGESSRSAYAHPSERRNHSPPPRRYTDDRDGGDRAPVRSPLDAGARRIAGGAGSRASSDAGSAGGGGSRSKDGPGWHRGVRPASRSRSRSRERGSASKRGASLGKLLDRFASAMHASMLATSAQSLAKSHLQRLQSFPGSSTESPALKEAASRVEDAQRSSRDRTLDMQDAFESLMRKMGNGGGSISAEREMDEVLNRIKRLESTVPGSSDTKDGLLSAAAEPPRDRPSLTRGTADPAASASPAIATLLDRPLPPPAASHAPPPPPPLDADSHMAEADEEDALTAKRRRAKDLLKSVMARLEAVEDERKQMVYRVDDLENLIWDQAETGGLVMTWERLESHRTARREAAVSRKRKRESDGGGQARPTDGDGGRPLEQTVDPPGSLPEVQAADSSSEVEGLRMKVEDLEKQLRSFKASQVGGTIAAPAAQSISGITATPPEDLDLLRQQVKMVGETLQKLLSEREAWKQNVVAACVTRFQADLQSKVGDLVKTHIQNTIASMRRDGTAVSPRAMTRALSQPANPAANTGQAAAQRFAPSGTPLAVSHSLADTSAKSSPSQPPVDLSAGRPTLSIGQHDQHSLSSPVTPMTGSSHLRARGDGSHLHPAFRAGATSQQLEGLPREALPSLRSSALPPDSGHPETNATQAPGPQQALYGNPIYTPVAQSGTPNTLASTSSVTAGAGHAQLAPESRDKAAAFMGIRARRRKILEKQIAALPADVQRQHLSDFDHLCANWLNGQPVDQQKLIAFLTVTKGSETIQPAEVQDAFLDNQAPDGLGKTRTLMQNPPTLDTAPGQATRPDSNGLDKGADGSNAGGQDKHLSSSARGEEEGQTAMDIEEGEIEG